MERKKSSKARASDSRPDKSLPQTRQLVDVRYFHPLRYIAFDDKISRAISTMWRIGLAGRKFRMNISNADLEELDIPTMADILQGIFGKSLFVFSAMCYDEQCAVIKYKDMRVFTPLALGLLYIAKKKANQLERDKNKFHADFQLAIASQIGAQLDKFVDHQIEPISLEQLQDIYKSKGPSRESITMPDLMTNDSLDLSISGIDELLNLTDQSDFNSSQETISPIHRQDRRPVPDINSYRRTISPDLSLQFPTPPNPQPYPNSVSVRNRTDRQQVPDTVSPRRTISPDHSIRSIQFSNPPSPLLEPPLVAQHRRKPQFTSLQAIENRIERSNDRADEFMRDVMIDNSKRKLRARIFAAEMALKLKFQDFEPEIRLNFELSDEVPDLLDSDDSDSASTDHNVPIISPDLPDTENEVDFSFPTPPDPAVPSPVTQEVGKDYTPRSKLSTMHAIAGVAAKQPEGDPVAFNQVAKVGQATKSEAAFAFSQMLELGKMGYLKLKQEPAENGFGPIEMTLTDSFDRNIPKPTFD